MAAFDLKAVKSSALTHVGHDADNNELHVKFKGGDAVYVIPCTTEEHATLMSMPSLGGAVNKLFGDRTPRKIEPKETK